ncbi:hypothetical protein JG677_02740 [Campylobacter sp. TTU-622]|uniref:hypothetical protein n=1 Tax=unclassified Campylobacter TaxID=2593542 RepID=UPI001904515D|nr:MULTISPECIES: hypothetical protein [unclassified Campylobacter]MBK1972241.1 hypothetical protein [Campylobacter sp. TTU_617]MBK1972972.1 hypothetical protein [Campylobacter sp. TTU-622]MBK1992028.1 hypothetical protein [Campylobacter sp. 2018MI34]
MAKFRVQYSAGFGHFTQNHKGFGPTIYIEEIVEFDNGKDYFDYMDFYKKYSKADDTYFHISFLEDRKLSEKELQIRNEYRKLRDQNCKKAKEEFIKNHELDPEFIAPCGD